jgi:hypothetical protein
MLEHPCLSVLAHIFHFESFEVCEYPTFMLLYFLCSWLNHCSNEKETVSKSTLSYLNGTMMVEVLFFPSEMEKVVCRSAIYPKLFSEVYQKVLSFSCIIQLIILAYKLQCHSRLLQIV